jgi:hypothetical protein
MLQLETHSDKGRLGLYPFPAALATNGIICFSLIEEMSP